MSMKTTIYLLLCLLILAVYGQVINHDFLNYDDNVYVTNNIHVLAGVSWNAIKWAFLEVYAANWHPLTWLSHILDCQLYGIKPAGHHLTSISLHIANTLLLFHLLCRLTGALWRSATVALLFAIHPLHVESVAWIAERKDVLSTLFFMLTLLAYLRYTESMRLKRYLSALIAFTAGLLAKPMLVTLPFILLLLDYWPLGRMATGNSVDLGGRPKPSKKVSLLFLIGEKLPFFFLALCSSLITYHAQQKGGAIRTLEVYPFFFRLENALVSYVGYMGKMFWPDNLACIYPLRLPIPSWQVVGASLVILSLSAITLIVHKKHHYFAFGWLWYLVTLLPVIGLVQIGVQTMADRYTYIPLIGLFVMVSWGLTDLFKGWRHQRFVLLILSVIVISTLTMLTWRQVGCWKNDFTLFNKALSSTDNNYVAQYELGNAFALREHFREAVYYYSLSLVSKSNQPSVHYNLGFAFTMLGESTEAARHYEEAIRIKPDYVEALYEQALLLIKLGKLDEAQSNFSRILHINPEHGDTNYNLGVIFLRKGDYVQAIQYFSEALRIMPDHLAARENLKACVNYKSAK